MSKTYLANDGAVLHFEISGAGPPLVMLHGFASSGQVFENQLAALEPHFTVYRPDLRGHGRSVDVKTGARAARLARDLHDLIVDQDLQDVRLVGWSMGCAGIWSYVDIFGEQNIHSYVFLDEIPYVLESSNTIGQRISDIDSSPLLGLHKRFADPATRTTEVAGFIQSMLLSTKGDARDAILKTAEHAANPLSVGLLLDNIATDYRDLIPRLTRPCLFMCGDSSFFDAKFFVWMNDVAQNSTLHIVPNAGHFLMIEHTDVVNAALLKFFQRA